MFSFRTLQWRHNGCDGVSNSDGSIVCSTVYTGADRRKHKPQRHRPLWGEFTSDRWIPLTKGQRRGKCFHLMTSSQRAKGTCIFFNPRTTYTVFTGNCIICCIGFHNTCHQPIATHRISKKKKKKKNAPISSVDGRIPYSFLHQNSAPMSWALGMEWSTPFLNHAFIPFCLGW